MDEDEILEEDNMFDEDDAFDYIMFRESEKDEKKGGGSGCLSTILVTISTLCVIAILAILVIA